MLTSPSDREAEAADRAEQLVLLVGEMREQHIGQPVHCVLGLVEPALFRHHRDQRLVDLVEHPGDNLVLCSEAVQDRAE